MTKITKVIVSVFFFFISDLLINSFFQKQFSVLLLSLYAALIVHAPHATLLVVVAFCAQTMIFYGLFLAPLCYFIPLHLLAIAFHGVIDIKQRIFGSIFLALCFVGNYILHIYPEKGLTYYTFLYFFASIIVMNVIFDIFVESR